MADDTAPAPEPVVETVVLSGGTVVHVNGKAHRTIGDTIVAVHPEEAKAPKAAKKKAPKTAAKKASRKK